MTTSIDARTLKAWLHDAAEIALLDVREHGQYGESHLFFGVPLPYSRLELDVPRLVPRKGTRIVAYDDGALGVAQLAAQRLSDVGYNHVHVLEGGTEAWRSAGFALYKGVNVPSKTFGEIVEHARHTPRITAAQLAQMQREGTPHVLLDGRPLAEFRKMSIPGATCCPNGELAYRIGELVRDERTPIVVNCAGRTRSIIGAQTLIELGIPNPVFALENGTQGWYLADFALDHGAARAYPDVSAARDLSVERARAGTLAARHGVRFVDDAQAQSWLDGETRNTYLCDVRTAEEFAQFTLRGAVHAPGGQLIQATDQWIGVRQGRILVFDSEGVRAPVVASWLRQMGHEAFVLQAGIASTVRAESAAVPLPPIAEGDYARDAVIVDVRPSMAYRKGHAAGSLWSIRPRFGDIAARVRGRDVLLVAEEDGVARIAAHDLSRCGARSVRRLRDARLTESTPHEPPDEQCIDYLFFVHDRHDGNKDAARRYLAWETRLLSQLDADERASYRLS
ncbi:MAG TPA: rhodanese-like domain-containing protein [Usitatibacter sp.]|nr:rhodanese-like domain-containing protein [Usitatibacter sp.]